MIRTTTPRRVLTAALAAVLLTAGGIATASPALAADEPLAPITVGTVTISGTPKVGEVLTANVADWPDGTTFTYEWYYNGGQFGGAIEGETADTYTVESDYIGLWIGVVVTGHLDGNADDSVSALTEDVAYTDQKPAAPAPVADSSEVPAYLSGAGAIAHTPEETGLPGSLDPEKGYTANVLWGTGDSFVDVYVYSAPVFLGTFPVVNGSVQIPIGATVLAGLAAGPHTLVAIGQSSGAVHGLAFQRAATLAATGAEATPFALVGGAMLLGGIALVLYRRRALSA